MRVQNRFKLVILGDVGVGKFAYVHYLKTGKYLDRFTLTCINIGAPLTSLDHWIEGEPATIFLFWKDWAETKPPIPAILQNFYMGTNGIIVLYDVTRRQTFDHVQDHIADAVKFLLQGSALILILGNKNDLEDKRQVDIAEGQTLAKKIGGDCTFSEISCKTGNGVKASLDEILNRYLKSRIDKSPK